MASKKFTGYLRSSLGSYASHDLWRFTHISTTGEVVAGSAEEFKVESNGFYDIDIEYGNVVIESKSSLTRKWFVHGSTVINSDTTATTLPALLNALVPVSDTVLLQMQTILQDAQDSASSAQQSASEAAAIVPTLQDDIDSKISATDQTVVTDADTLFADGVHRILNLSPGNVNGLAGARSLLHMQTDQGGFQLAARTLGHEVHIRVADLNTGNVGTWSRLYTTEYKPTAADVGAYDTGEVDSIEAGLQGQIDSLDDEYVRRYVGVVTSQDWNSLVDSGNYRVSGSVGANHPSTPTIGSSYDYGLLLTLNDSNDDNGVKTHLYFPHNQNSPDVGSRLPVYRSGYFGDYGNWRALLSLQYADIRYSQVSSDERLKTDIEEVKDALDIVEKIGSYSYIKENAEVTQVIKDDGEYTGSEEHYRFEMGFIAQEIEKVLPHLVKDDVYGYKAIKSGNNTLLAVAYQAIRELNEENKQLKGRLTAIEAHLGLGE